MDNVTLDRLEKLFFMHGYEKIPSNLPEFNFFCHREVQGMNVLYVIDYRQGLYISEDQYAHMKEKIADFFRARGDTELHMMTFVLCADTKKARKLCEWDRFCWIIDTQACKLLIHETQTADFYGWKNLLEEYLFELSSKNRDTADVCDAPGQKKDLRTLPWANIILVAVNVIVFLICTFTGELLYNKGALSVPLLWQGGGYRLFTSMFLHWGVEHLFSNMVVLYYVGALVERELGHGSYMVLYLVSGFAGNIFSIGYEMLMQSYGNSVGASGAVFGVEGALLFLAMAHRGRLASMTAGRVAFAVAFSLYCGFTSAGVNNAAHVGGVLAGFVMAAAITGYKRLRALSSRS